MSLDFLCCAGKRVTPLPSDDSTRKRFHGEASITGRKQSNPQWENQDSFAFDESRNSFAVFDGHGPYGHLVARFAKQRSFAIFNKIKNVENAFLQLHRELEEGQIETDLSGTTCALIKIQNKCIEAYNVGDSRAVLGRRESENGKSVLRPVLLTRDHVPSDVEEKERITEYGGECCAKMIRNSGLEHYGPVRVWFNYQSRIMGLSMTRSLGDLAAHKVGVLSLPYSRKERITPKDEYIILATDGVFDVLDYDEIFNVIKLYKSVPPEDQHEDDWDPQHAADIIASKARACWPSEYRDDITCCVIKLKDSSGPLFL